MADKDKIQQIEGGKHGIRHYEGFDEEQHIKDVTGNNAQIEILEKAVVEIEKKKQEEVDQEVDS